DPHKIANETGFPCVLKPLGLSASRGVIRANNAAEFISAFERIRHILDKPDPLEGPFFEETIYVTPSREPPSIQSAIIQTVRRAVKALGLTHGPIHAEVRVNSAGVYMLEVAARPIGGLCARGLRFGGAMTLEEIVILHAIGKMPRD